MDHPNSNRAEALRWFNIAERLLGARDFLGAKSFAIRARDSDPVVVEAANRVIAVADTLLAAESPIINQPDWYGILQLARPTQSVELIASHYRRLAFLLNPESNHPAHADDALKLVTDAWFVLSNPLRKALYDNELNLYLKNEATAAGTTQKRRPLEDPPEQRQPPQRRPPGKSHSQAQPTQQPKQQWPEQPSQTVRKNPSGTSDGKAAVEAEMGNTNNVSEAIKRARPSQDAEVLGTKSSVPSFWTACPYCFNLFEYPQLYHDCVLKCQNCERAFQAVGLQSPPISDKEDYYCCWGLIPLGITGNAQKIGRNWMPISSMFVCPLQGQGIAKKANAPKKSNPRLFYDGEDIYEEVTNPSESSDEDWESGRTKTATKSGRTKTATKKDWLEKRASTERVKKGSQVSGGEDSNVGQFGSVETGLSNSSKNDSSKKVGATSSGKRQKGKGMRKLDLNVEFSNEVEEAAPRISQGGNGEEDNMEGTAFFEGLDEFLSSLPILNVVADDKVKTG